MPRNKSFQFTAQDAARLYAEQYPSRTHDQEVQHTLGQLLEHHVRPAARRDTSITLRVDPPLVAGLVSAFHDLGYDVTSTVQAGTPTGALKVSWPRQPFVPPTHAPTMPPPPPAPPREVEVQPSPTQLLSRLFGWIWR
ncbi:hypothetical protein [Deinococcus multiflagellatus]|uniref:Uncharacterized protein n=1 Tax=Deinococcus multiflagellatus TaxID=1656887 RepID=A0ABW1ZRE6_9DEIO|nr:hypothetical protein [Deinococcus multiflagellatus]MBZ9715327.1 hypothetical protein [Deinococcus multiflagellatus]